VKFSEQWLREWVNPALDSEALGEQITMAGLEVDAIEPVAGAFDGVVVGEIIAAEPHPDADKLRVCRVDAGAGEELQIVCGAPNARAGLKAPLAMVGATLPDDFAIKAAKLRGVESRGMLCAAEELGLSEDRAGLMELPDDAPVGVDLRAYLGLDDVSIEIGLTPNRADCLSIAGIAREVGLLNDLPVCEVPFTSAPEAAEAAVSVDLQAPARCPRYLCRIIEGVDLSRPSPVWMQERLRRCGLRSIDAAVDITNFLLLELGQPMHAFDLEGQERKRTLGLAIGATTLLSMVLHGNAAEAAPKRAALYYAAVTVAALVLLPFAQAYDRPEAILYGTTAAGAVHLILTGMAPTLRW